MATRLVDQFIRMQEKRLSRRGFLAKLGGVTAGLALMLVGAGSLAKRVQAAQCCQNPLCGTGLFPPCTGGGATCPTICSGGGTNVCCDQGQVGSTNTEHQCQTCNCGPTGVCVCEFDTGIPC